MVGRLWHLTGVATGLMWWGGGEAEKFNGCGDRVQKTRGRGGGCFCCCKK